MMRFPAWFLTTILLHIGNSAPMSVDKGPLHPAQLIGRPLPIQESTALPPYLHCTEQAEADSYQYGSNLTWMTATPETAEESEADFMDNTSQSAFEEDSPDFVLAKGHITPNNLLPGWDDEIEEPWGPRKGYYDQPLRRRSGQLATFDERLQEVGSVTSSLCTIWQILGARLPQ